MIRLILNGRENGKRAYLARKKALGGLMTFASVCWNGQDWEVRRHSGRIDRFGSFGDAKDEVLKG
jgi:hypothetical protein